MKTVFNNSELCHVFNQRTQYYGRGNNMYFDNGALYSYGSHFKICQFAENKGRVALLFTLRDYSNTTSKHKIKALRACRDREIIYCHYPGDAHLDNFNEWRIEVENIKYKLPKARKLSKYYEDLQTLYDQAKKYADFWDVKLPECIEEIQTILNNPETIEKIKKQQKQEAAQKLALKIAREAKERREAAEQAREFRQGKRTRVTCGNLDFLRLENDVSTENFEYEFKPYIITSQQVKIPYDVARQFWQAVKFNKVKIGDKLEQFTVNHIDAKNINIGCHKFTRRQLVNFGNTIFQS